MFRFSIRDVLWLTVVVGVFVAWWLDHRSITPNERETLKALKGRGFGNPSPDGSFPMHPPASIAPGTIPGTFTTLPSPPIKVPSTDGQSAGQPYVVSSTLIAVVGDAEQWAYTYSDGQVIYETKTVNSGAAKK
jgi:hypothetical protein